jgi:drug/metabolite transporter (DMT)-like permease
VSRYSSEENAENLLQVKKKVDLGRRLLHYLGSMEKGEFRGYLYILIGATLWGVSSVVAKSLFNIGLPASEVVLVRLTLATFILFLVLLISNRNRIVISTRDLPYFLVFGTVAVLGNQFTFYLAVSKLQVAPAVIINYLSIFWVTLYAFLVQRQRISKMTVLSLLLAMSGCYLVMGGYHMDFFRLNRMGIIVAVLSSFFAAFYTLYGEKGLRRYDAWTLILYGFGIGAISCSIFVPPTRILTGGHSLKVWAAFLYIAVFSTLIPFGLYLKGIASIRATRASITATWEPVMSGLTAFFVLGEVLHGLQVLGGIAVILAVILLQIGREKTASLPAREPAESRTSETHGSH